MIMDNGVTKLWWFQVSWLGLRRFSMQPSLQKPKQKKRNKTHTHEWISLMANISILRLFIAYFGLLRRHDESAS